METCCCDLCGSAECKAFPRAITWPQTVVICRRCGFVYTNPRWSDQEIQKIYNEEFADDPGAPAVDGSEDAAFREENFHKARAAIQADVLPLLAKHVEPRGKKWLELRFRSGALLAELHVLGAQVHGVDPFAANVRWAQSRLPEATLHVAPMSDLLGPVRDQFDVVSMLTIHVPAHVPAPSRLVRQAYECLKPGGLLLLDEKDVGRPGRNTTQFAFQYPYGMVHYCHLTRNSARALVEKAGFEVLHAEFTPRTSAQRHFLIVARKPMGGSVSNPRLPADNPRRLYWRLLWQYVRLVARRKRRSAAQRVLRALGQAK